MNGVQLIQANIGVARQSLMGTMGDVTPAQARYQPAGSAHSIIANYLHILQTEDMAVQQVCQGKPSIWDKDGWQKKTSVAYSPGQTAEWSKSVKTDQAALKPYADAVFAATDAYVAKLKDADLDRKVQAPFGESSVGAFLQIACGANTFMHTGEIAVVKGVQGGKGYPF